MGIAKGATALLYELKKDFGLFGSVLQLGKQTIHLDQRQLSEIAKKFGFEYFNNKNIKLDDINLFKSLGFDSVKSLDANDYENADIIFDFNKEISENAEKFDLVFDGGTLEHIFSLPQSLKNIHNLLKVGGRVAHLSPSHNHVVHGFYMFSPTVFWDYYAANKYKILKFYIFEYENDHAGIDWLIYEYAPGSIDALSYGGWGTSLLGIWCVAEKLPESTCDVIPQQGGYVKTWNTQPTQKMGLNRISKIKILFKNFIRPHQTLYKILYKLLSAKPSKPNVMNRY